MCTRAVKVAASFMRPFGEIRLRVWLLLLPLKKEIYMTSGYSVALKWADATAQIPVSPSPSHHHADLFIVQCMAH